MPTKTEQIRVAIVDDYQNVTRPIADWSALDGRAAITVFNDQVDGTDAVVARLQPFRHRLCDAGAHPHDARDH